MKIKQLLIVTAIGTMVAACSSRDDYSLNNDDNVIRLKANIDGMNVRAAGSSGDLQNTMFYDGEEVNVYISDAGTDQKVDGISGDYLTYIADDNWGLTTTESPLYPESGTVNIYAIHPSTIDKTSTTFSVQDNQSTEANYRASDLMSATELNVPKTYGSIELTFSHCLSKVIVNIDFGDTGLSAQGLDMMQINNIYKTVDITHNSTNGIVLGSNLTNKGSVAFDIVGDGVLDYSGGWTAIVIPQTIPAGTKLFSFLVSGSSTFECITDTDIELKPGFQYTFTLKLDLSGVAVSYYYMNNWQNDTGYQSEITATPQ
ncbi:MAG: fimbrillin family protein [Prevotella sp.]